MPRLTRSEKRVLLAIPALWPDGDSHDLKITGMDHEAISYAVQHLIGLGLVSASQHEGVHPFAPYFRGVELATDGEELRRDIERPALSRFWEKEWKWLISVPISIGSLALSIWNFLHAPPPH